VRRIVGMLTIVLAASCGAENWSFDHDAGEDVTDVPTVEGSVPDQDAGQEASLQDGAYTDTGVAAAESGPTPEATPGCSIDSDCPGASPLCSAAGTCIRCESAADCHPDAGAPACNATTGACVECASSSDCAAIAARPYCDPENQCVRCLSNADCGFESICQITTHTCSKMF
jgi:hypothetical protein